MGRRKAKPQGYRCHSKIPVLGMLQSKLVLKIGPRNGQVGVEDHIEGLCRAQPSHSPRVSLDLLHDF